MDNTEKQHGPSQSELIETLGVEQNRRTAIDRIGNASNFIVITYSPENGVDINTSIGAYAFTMLGAIELAKQNLIQGFEHRANVEQGIEP